MDTPKISADLRVNHSPEKPSTYSSPVRNLFVENGPKVDKVDHVKVITELGKAVDILNEALAKDPIALRFSIDETLKRPIVTVVSEQTGEVVRQLPQEEVLRAVKNIDRMRGILFEEMG